MLILGTVMYHDHQRVLALRDENPAEYLDRIKGRDSFWDELKELDPERYAAEWPAEQKRREEAAKQQAEADLARYLETDRQRYWDIRKETEPEIFAEIMNARQDEFFYKVVRDIEDQPRYPSQENMDRWLTARNIISSQDGADMYRLVASMSFNGQCEGRDLYVGFGNELQDAMAARANRLRAGVVSIYGRYPNFSSGLNYLNNTALSAGAYIANNDTFNGDACLYYDRPLIEYYSDWLLPYE